MNVDHVELMPVPRAMPQLDNLNQAFWTGGRLGELLIQSCRSCSLYVHPPAPLCRECLSSDLGYIAVSGLGTTVAVSVNHKAWSERPVPYSIALVELDEQDGLRVMTNIVGVEPDQVMIGMRVQVTFENHGSIFIPVFKVVEEQ